MSHPPFDPRPFITNQGRIPRPRWDEVRAWIGEQSDQASRRPLWTEAARGWLAAVCGVLGEGYQVGESAHFLALAHRNGQGVDWVLRMGEQCRAELQARLPDVVNFSFPGKEVVLVFRNAATYYTHVAPFFQEGLVAPTGGVRVRDGYPHIAAYGRDAWSLLQTLSHEVLHAALDHLRSPLWVEEGLAQLCQVWVGGGAWPLLELKGARRHRRFWNKRGLSAFWTGESFTRPGRWQTLSYELARILVQSLLEQHRPRWLGLDWRPTERFEAFLLHASIDDAGDAAARVHLGFGLAEVVSQFLGVGDWNPANMTGVADRRNPPAGS